MNNQDVLLVSNYLKQHAVGKQNTKRLEQIQKATGLKSGGKTYEYIRSITRYLIMDEGYLIAGGQTGCWIISNETELQEAADLLTCKANGILQRRNQLLKNWKIKELTEELDTLRKENI